MEEAEVLNESCINSLRVARKQIKKLELMVKQLHQANTTLRD